MDLSLRALRLFFVLIAGLTWLGLTATAVVGPTLPELVQPFDEYLAYEYTQVLATQFDGRRAGTPAGRAAAQFIATAFEMMGLQPAGDNGTYFQNFEMPFLELAETPELTLLSEGGRARTHFRHRVDFRENIAGNSGPGRAEAEVVFVGAGGPDEFAAIDVANKIALVLPRAGASTNAIVREAMNQGALGVLLLAASEASVQIKPSYLINLAPQVIPALRVTRATADALLEKSGETVSTVVRRQPYDLGVRVRLSVVLQPIETVTVSNVLGLLPGTDPVLRNKVVIVGGHYDHVGRDPNGTLFPGANDNASGTAVTLAIAKLFTSLAIRPRASILFVGWGAEEAGLVGSEHYVQHPVFALEDTLASLVLDVVGRGEGLQLVASGNPTLLLEEIRASAEALGLPVHVQNGGGGSDHGPFLDAHVPAVLFIWEGSVQTIHRPDDTIERIDRAKLRTTGMIAALTALQLARVRP
jgi:hypothetical protein